MRLRSLPAAYVDTRDALHQVAFFVLGPVRYLAEGRMGLQAAPGGFGTPRFDGRRIARVEGESIVLEESDEVASQTITTVRAAADLVGIEYRVDWFADFHDPLQPIDPDSPLGVDDASSRALGQWFNFGFEVLERLCGHAVEGDDVTDVQLWPEHFDPAIELGREDEGRRASFGASPGDSGHQEPYVYVAPWGAVDESDPYWNSTSFKGSLLGYSDLASADDPVATALEFLLAGSRILHAS